MQRNRQNIDNPARRRYWHPYLIALYPVANLYSSNYSAVALGDVVMPMLAVLVFGFLVYSAWSWLCSSAEKAAIAASWTIGWFFSYALLTRLFDLVYRKVLAGDSRVYGEYVLVAWGLLWLAGVFCILQTSRKLQLVNGYLNTVSIVLLATSAAILGQHWYADRNHVQVEDSQRWLQEPVSLNMPSQPIDIYYLVFDRYANEDTLREKFHLDNSEFLDQLRLRGFVVAKDSRANYPCTIYSMASALNMCYLGDEVQNDKHYSRMIDNHSVGRSLVDVGYRYHHFGNRFQPLRSSKNAHVVFATSALPSEYADALYSTTPLSKVLRKQKFQLETERFGQVAELARDDRPTFAYAHFLLPHPPYVMDQNGVGLPWAQMRYGDPQENYRGQLQGTNKLIIQMIDRILEDSLIPPIIVLQADEGPYWSEQDQALDRKNQILTKSRILTAIHLPESPEAPAIAQTISPVNTFRLIFREYFGAEIDLLPDRTYFWDHEDKYGRPSSKTEHIIDVTSQISD